MARMNGWQRLWTVAVVISGLTALYNIMTTFPTERGLDFSYQTQLRWLQERKTEISNPPHQNTLLPDIFPIETIDVINQKIKQAARDHQQAVSALPDAQMRSLATPIILWIISSCLLYATGIVFGWVLRGFRNSDSST